MEDKDNTNNIEDHKNKAQSVLNLSTLSEYGSVTTYVMNKQGNIPPVGCHPNADGSDYFSS